MATDVLSPEFRTVDLPQDEKPAIDGVPFDPRYPGSTADAPYGFKPNGEPYKRHHSGNGGSKGGKSVRNMPASDVQARSAAGVLATANKLLGMALLPILPATAVAIVDGNEQFEEMAFQALLSDPALCKKILSAGTSSGKAQLFMAYGAFGMSVAPTALAEVKAKRAERDESDGTLNV